MIPEWAQNAILIPLCLYLLISGIIGVRRRSLSSIAMALMFGARTLPRQEYGRRATGMGLAQAFIGTALLTVLGMFWLDAKMNHAIYWDVPPVLITELVAFLILYIIVMHREKRLYPEDWRQEKP